MTHIRLILIRELLQMCANQSHQTQARHCHIMASICQQWRCLSCLYQLLLSTPQSQQLPPPPSPLLYPLLVLAPLLLPTCSFSSTRDCPWLYLCTPLNKGDDMIKLNISNINTLSHIDASEFEH